MQSKYTPIDPDYFDIVENEILKNKHSKIFYFDQKNQVEEESGKIEEMVSVNNFEKYLLLNTAKRIRMDKIITINGIPGPAYDEYDKFALACLECNIGGGG